MNAQPVMNRPTAAQPSSLPDDLTSAESKLVYFYLRTARTATVDEIQDRLDMSKISLYPVLRSLEDRDLVESDGERYAVPA